MDFDNNDQIFIHQYREFLQACRKGDLECVQHMIIGCENHELRNSVRGNTMEDVEWPPALLCASFGGHLSVVQYLVEELDIDYGETAVMRAAHEGHLDIVKYLIEQGADPTAVNQLGANALIRACHYDRLHIIRYLIEDIDVDPNPSNKNDWSAVGEASMRGKLRTVKYLCEEVTVNIVMKDYHCRCPVIMATAYGELHILQYLTSNYLELIDDQLQEALMIGCLRGYLPIIKHVLSLPGIDSKETPLMLAASRGDLTLVKFLVNKAKGINLFQLNEWGQTALKLAMEGHKQSVVQYLTKKMAEEAHKRRLCTNYKDLSNAAWKRISVETAASVPVSGTVEEVGTKRRRILDRSSKSNK